MNLYPNKLSGTCCTCQSKVPAQTGFVFKEGTRYTVVCNSDKCIPSHVLQAHQTKVKQDSRKELTSEGELYFPYDPEALPLLRAFPPFPGKKFWDPEKKCRNVSLESKDRNRVLELCEKLGIQVAPELLTFSKDPMTERALERCKAHALYPFQPEGVEFLASRKKALLADDMGLGKSVQTLLAIDNNQGVVVVCPSSVKFNWAEEARKWRPDLTCFVLEGKGVFQWPKAGEVVISNFEILPSWLMPTVIGVDANGKEMQGVSLPDLPSLRNVNFKNTILVVDEAHRTKNYRTNTHKKVKELATLCGRVWLLTGTPIENRPTDLYGILQVGGMEYDVFGGWSGFVRCFNGTRSGYRGSYVWGTPSPETPERLRRVMLRRLKDDVLKDLPSVVWKDMVVNGLDIRLKQTMNNLYQKMSFLLDDGILPSFEEISEVRSLLATSRIPAMLDIVEDYEEAGKPLVVFSAYKAPIECFSQRDGWRVITGEVSAKERQEIVREFQAGKLKGVGLTIQAGGVGLTLTHASDVLFVDLCWTPTLNSQAADRVRRIGQQASSIQIIRLVSDHPLDKRVHEILSSKMNLIQKALEEVSYTIKTPVSMDIQQESQAEFDARLALIQELEHKAQQQQAKQRIIDGGWLQGERSKSSLPEIHLTSDLKNKIRDALIFMLNQCDGANLKDYQGFNKPDAGRARVLMCAGLNTDEEFRIAERMLSRYHRQLHAHYPEIFS